MTTLQQRLWTLCLCLSIGTTMVWAQQPAQYSLFMLNKYAYNNAYNGLDQSLSITGVFRKQWTTFPGSPLNFNFTAHLPLEMISSGVGFGVEYDALGAYTNITVRGSYSYILDFKDQRDGIELEVNQCMTSYSYTDKTIKIPNPFGCSKRCCDSKDGQLLRDMLQTRINYKIDGNNLTLTTDKNIIQFLKADIPPKE